MIKAEGYADLVDSILLRSMSGETRLFASYRTGIANRAMPPICENEN